MAEMIRSRQISPEELMNAHLKQIEQINPSLNAVVEFLPQTSAPLAGPLHGVPFSIKDSIDVAGVKTTAGTLGRRNAAPAQKNATLVDRLINAGAVPIAKTNLPDLLFSFETDNLIYGGTNNPYDVTRTPGGSSGGDAGPATFVSPLSTDPVTLRRSASHPAVGEALARIDERVGGEDRQVIVRVDRMELSKNLLRGFWAFEELLHYEQTVDPEDGSIVSHAALGFFA